MSQVFHRRTGSRSPSVVEIAARRRRGRCDGGRLEIDHAGVLAPAFRCFKKKIAVPPRTTLHILLSSTFARAILRRLHFVDNDIFRSSSSAYPSSVTWRYYPTKILHLQSQMCLPRNGDHPSKGSSIFIPHHLAQLHHVIINIFKLQRKRFYYITVLQTEYKENRARTKQGF